VEQFINQDGRPDLEKKFGNNLTILHHRKHEKPISSLLSAFENDLDKLKIEQLLSDQNSFPFSHFDERLKQTKIFLLKVHGKSYQEIAEYFETTTDEIQKIFNACKDRFIIALDCMDNRRKICSQAADIIKRQEAKTGSIPAMKKQFLLSKLFDLTPAEIGKMMGIKTSTVMTNLKDYSLKNPSFFEERMTS
jgi:DNA-binding CsgD family transcriptional regulator